MSEVNILIVILDYRLQNALIRRNWMAGVQDHSLTSYKCVSMYNDLSKNFVSKTGRGLSNWHEIICAVKTLLQLAHKPL